MTQQDTPFASGFSDLGQRAMDSMVDAQKGFLGAIQDINQQWLSGVNAEAALASDFFSKLAAAKSLPDAAAVYQSCATRQMQIMTESGQKIMAAGQKMLSPPFGSGPSARSRDSAGST